MFAIIRTYNNSLVFKLIDKLIKTKLFSKVVVVVNISADKIGTVDKLHATYGDKYINIVPLTEWGWSKAINAGLRKIAELGNYEDSVLMISNKVGITVEDIVQLQAAARNQNASCGFALFDGRKEASYLVPRNTCALWKLALFYRIGFFDESLDSQGGMEDYEMVLRAYQKEHRLPFLGPRKVRLLMSVDSDFYMTIEKEIKSIQHINSQYSVSIVSTVQKHLKRQNLTD